MCFIDLLLTDYCDVVEEANPKGFVTTVVAAAIGGGGGGGMTYA